MNRSGDELLLWEAKKWHGQSLTPERRLTVLRTGFNPAREVPLFVCLSDASSNRVPRVRPSVRRRPGKTPLPNPKLRSKSSSSMRGLYAKMAAISSLEWKTYDPSCATTDIR
jgi:hypothetical protein